jgi:hypothetical protein
MDHHSIAGCGDVIGDSGSDGVDHACGLVAHDTSS